MSRLRCFEVGRLNLREMVITLRCCRFAEIKTEIMCAEKKVSERFVGNNVWLEVIEAEKDDGG